MVLISRPQLIELAVMSRLPPTPSTVRSKSASLLILLYTINRSPALTVTLNVSGGIEESVLIVLAIIVMSPSTSTILALVMSLVSIII